MQRQSSVQPATATGWRPGAGEHGRQERRGRRGGGARVAYVCMFGMQEENARPQIRSETFHGTGRATRDQSGSARLDGAGMAWGFGMGLDGATGCTRYSSSIYSRTEPLPPAQSCMPTAPARPAVPDRRGKEEAPGAVPGPSSHDDDDDDPAAMMPVLHINSPSPLPTPMPVSLQTRTHPYLCACDSTRPGGQYDSTTWRRISSISPPDGLGSFS